MRIKRLKSSYKQMKESNKTMLLTNCILTACLGASLFFNATKDTVVISNVNQSCENMMISSSKMNPATHEKLGFFLASMLGNITPNSAEYVANAVLPYISPDRYYEVQELIALQVKGIKADRVTTSFSPEKSIYENGVTFISGKYTTTGATGIKKTNMKTYEFIFDVANYTPTASYLALYDGVAHTVEWERKNKDRKIKGDK